MVKQQEKLVGEKIKWIAEIITAIGVISGIGYGIGRWQSHMEHKAEIIELRQKYNEEISSLKIDYNNRIIELQNELKIIEISKK